MSVDLMARLLPPEVVTRETTGDLAPTVGFAEEEAAVARAVESRRREFFTTRACARQALAELSLRTTGRPGIGLAGGAPARSAIPRTSSGAPRWPDGITGSLTHCDGYRAAAVVWRHQYLSVGIDAEPRAALPADVVDIVATSSERAGLARLAGRDPTVPWDRVLFSAKESVYKALHPVTGQWLDFADVEVTIAPDGVFTARLRRPESVVDGRDVLVGRWGGDRRLVGTAVVVDPAASGSHCCGRSM